MEPTAPVPVIVPAKLSEIELLLIICALLFLTLLLLGIGIAYYCLKRRNIRIIRRKKLISPAPSEITKLSSVFDQIRIPRVIAPSTESSTDYPSSESDERRTIVSETSTIRNDHFKYENTAFVPEPYPVDIEKEDSVTSVPLPVAHKPIITSAGFQETLLQTEYLTEENVIDTHHKRTTACLYKKLPTSKITPSIPDNDNWSQAETEDRLTLAPYVKPVQLPRIKSRVIDDTYLTNQTDTEIDETLTRHKKITARTPPKLTVVKTDDIFVTSIQETDVTEDRTIHQHGIRGTSDHILTSEELLQEFHSKQDATRSDFVSSSSSHHLKSGPASRPKHKHEPRSTTTYISDLQTDSRTDMRYTTSREQSHHTSDVRSEYRNSSSFYDMQDMGTSQTQRRDHFRLYDEKYAVEQERDESITTVPVTRKPKSNSVTYTDYEERNDPLDSNSGIMTRTATMIYNLPGGFVRRPSIPDDVWSQAETEVRHTLATGGPRSIRDFRSQVDLSVAGAAPPLLPDSSRFDQQQFFDHQTLTQPNLTSSATVQSGRSREVHEAHRGMQRREQVFTSSYQRESRLE